MSLHPPGGWVPSLADNARNLRGVEYRGVTTPRKNDVAAKPPRHPVSATETTGLLLVAFLLLVLTLVRYRHVIHWSVR